MAQPHIEDDARPNYAVRHLIAAAVTTTIALVGVIADLMSPDQLIPSEIRSVLIAAPIVAWCTYRSRCAEERLLHGQAELRGLITQRLTGVAEAEAYVDGLMRRVPEERVLRSV